MFTPSLMQKASSRLLVPKFSFVSRATPGADPRVLSYVAKKPRGNWVIAGANNFAGGDMYFLSSPDGDIWTERATPYAGSGLNGYSSGVVIWDGTRFVSGCDEGAGAWAVITSLNGVTWADRPITTGVDYMRNIAYDPASGMYSASGVGSLKSSPDLTNWTARTNPGAGGIGEIIWSAADGLFVLVKNGGAALKQVMTSPDGIAWTERATPTSANLRGLAYNEADGVYCAVGYGDGTDLYILTATDPTGTWTERSNSGPSDSISSLMNVCAFPGGFIAVGAHYTGAIYHPIIWVSTDKGETWVEITDHPNYLSSTTKQYNGVFIEEQKIVIAGSDASAALLISN